MVPQSTPKLRIASNAITLTNDEGSVVAEIDFPALDEHTVTITRTFVDESLRGKGYAGVLMNACVAELEKTHRHAKVACSYADAWFSNHPEKAHLLAS